MQFAALNRASPGLVLLCLSVLFATPIIAGTGDDSHQPAGAGGTLQGSVTGLGYCADNPAPLAGAMVFVDGQEDFFAMTTTVADGSYSVNVSESASPFNILVAMGGYASGMENGIEIGDQQTVTVDFDLLLGAPCATAQPQSYAETVDPGEIATFDLTVGNSDGLAAMSWEIFTATSSCATPDDVAWLTVDPANGDTDAGDTSAVMVTASALSGGESQALICVAIDYADAPLLEVPFHLTVAGVESAILDLDPEQFEVNIEMSQSAQHALAIANAGSATLNWEIDPDGGDGRGGDDLLKEGALLVLDLNGQIVALDPETGDLIDPNFIDFDIGGGVKDQLLLHPDRDRLLMSHQTGNAVHAFGLDGEYQGIFAPAGGVDHGILRIARGMAFHPETGNLLVTSGAGDNAHAVVEFDQNGHHLGNFIDNGAGGLQQPWGIVARENDILVGANGNDAILRYTLDGEPAGVFAQVTNPRQLFETPSGNILVAAATSSSANAGVHEFDAGGNLLGHYNVTGSTRGVHELGNGNLLATNSAGVHEIDRDNNLIDTKHASAQAQFVTFVHTRDCSVPTWLELDVLSGSIDAGDPARTVTLTFDTAGLEPGIHTASFCVLSNDPERPLVEVPVTMTVDLPPDHATIEGTVTSAGYCGDQPAPLAGASVVISGSGGIDITLTTDNDGRYDTYLPDSTSPLNFSVSAPAHLSAHADGVEIVGGDALVRDFELSLDAPCATVDTSELAFDLLYGQQQTQTLTIGNIAGAGALSWDLAAVQGFRQAHPRAHFPATPYVPQPVPALAPAFTQADPTAATTSSAPAAGSLAGTMAVPTYGIAAAPLNDYVMLDALEPGHLISIRSPRPNRVYAQTFIDYDFTRHYFISSAPAQGANLPGNAYGYVDTATGVVTILGTVTGGPPGSPTWGGLTWDRTTGTVYALANPSLYTVDLDTGEASLIGTIAGEGVHPEPTFITIAASPDGLLYAIDIVTNTLVAIDKTDASAATIGSLGINAIFAQDMAFDDSTGILYWASYQGSGISNMRTVNLENGSTSLIGPIENGAEIVAMSIAVASGGCQDPHSVDWLSVNPPSGTITPGGQETIEIAVDSSGLTQGRHEAFLCLATDDPHFGSLAIPVELEVTDPNAGTLQGSVTGGGHCGNDSQPLANATVLIQGSNGSFERTTDSNGFYQIPLNQGESPIDIMVSADNHVDGTASGIIVEADTTTTADIDLMAELGCTDAHPGEMHATVPPGGSTTQTLTLTNSGAASSTFEISSRFVAAPTREIEITLAGRDPVAGRLDGNSRSSHGIDAIAPRQQTVTIPVRQNVIRVLVVSPDSYVSTPPHNLVNDLNAFPDIEASLFDEPNLGGITADALNDFDVVIATSNNRWVAVEADVAIGNALADYVDQGGRVILHNFALDAVFSPPQHFHMRGRYIEEDYAPMTLAPSDILVTSSTMVPLVPSHPIFDNVTAVSYGENYRNTGHTLTAGAELLAEWDDGVPMLAINEHSIYINALYSRQGMQGYWSGDLNILVYNAVQVLAGAPIIPAEWLAFEPETGSVTASGDQQTDVTFSAAPGLAEGIYEADIMVTVNDGLNYFGIAIPATLTVAAPAEDGIFSDRLEQQ